MHFTRCNGVYEVQGHTAQCGHFENSFGGHARTLHLTGACGWFQEDVGPPAARHQAKHKLDK